MKKRMIWVAFAALMSLIMTGCKSDEPGKKMRTETLDLTVIQKDWQFDSELMQFYYHFDVPEITGNVYNYGTWTISREYNKGYKDAYQVALPMSYFGHDTLPDGAIVYYTQHIDYRLGVGYVEVQVTNSDYPYPVDPATGKPVPGDFTPEDMDFRLQLMY